MLDNGIVYPDAYIKCFESFASQRKDIENKIAPLVQERNELEREAIRIFAQ